MNYTIQAHGLAFTASSLGAEAQSLRSDGREWLWQGDSAVWGRRAPLCFPLCGRCRDGYFVHGGVRYQSGPHGFARDLEHSLAAQTDDSLTFRLESTPDTLARYPWPFRLDTAHALSPGRLTTTCAVTNTGTSPMPFQLGFHFAFSLPEEGESRLAFQVPEHHASIVHTPGGLVGDTGPFSPGAAELALDEALFANDSICLHGLESRSIRLLRSDGAVLELDVAGFPYVLLWSKPGKPKFVCIEPWHGLPDAVDSGHDLFRRPAIRVLAPGETFTASHIITLQSTKED